MSKDSSRTFTPSEINSVVFDIREGKADPDDARALLVLFCQCVEQGSISRRNPVADCLLEHVREAFRAYLNGKRIGNRDSAEVAPGKHERGIIENKISNIESAFGLVRKKGRPKADEQARIRMAAAVLHRRLTGTGMPHENAVAEVAEHFGKSESVVGEAWRAHLLSAVAEVLQSRSPDEWTDIESIRLRKILGKITSCYSGKFAD